MIESMTTLRLGAQAQAQQQAVPTAPAQSSPARRALKDFVSGGVGGAALALVGHPFDTVKVLLQTRQRPPATTAAAATAASFPASFLFRAPPRAGPPVAAAAGAGAGGGGALAVAREVVAAHGARGLYRGISPVLLGVAPTFAVCFWAFGEAKTLLRGLSGARSDRELSLVSIGLAGALSALPTTLIMAPGERIKIAMQTNAAFRGGALGVARELVRAGGARSLFRGSAATLARDASGSFAWFGVYEGVRRSLTPAPAPAPAPAPSRGAARGAARAEPTTAAVLLAGGLAGVANWLVALPLDTVKSRIQQQELLAPPGQPGAPAPAAARAAAPPVAQRQAAAAPRAPASASASASASAPAPSLRMLPTARALVRAEGWPALYRGLGPVLLRAFPANAACFFAMETARRALDAAAPG